MLSDTHMSSKQGTLVLKVKLCT